MSQTPDFLVPVKQTHKQIIESLDHARDTLDYVKNKLQQYDYEDHYDCDAAFAGKSIAQWRSLQSGTFETYVNTLNENQWAELEQHIAKCTPENLRLNLWQRNCANRNNGCGPKSGSNPNTGALNRPNQPFVGGTKFFGVGGLSPRFFV